MYDMKLNITTHIVIGQWRTYTIFFLRGSKSRFREN